MIFRASCLAMLMSPVAGVAYEDDTLAAQVASAIHEPRTHCVAHS